MRRCATAGVLAFILGLGGVASATALAATPVDLASATPSMSGIPSGAPAAAYRPEPALPVPAGWPFPEAFPRTSGTGRLAGGAYEWSDFLYDDHGATGAPMTPYVAGLAPPAGTYGYANPAADSNGADIFRAAVALDSTNTWWRVDWNTLADPSVPLAVWTFDTDANPLTGGSRWPAGVGVSSAGFDLALVVSSRGAWLVNPTTGRRDAVKALGGTVITDTSSRSFVVRIPTKVMRPSATWTVRLAAAVADATGEAAAPVDALHGALSGQPAVYNVTFRGYRQEPPEKNPWMENVQAAALTAGDVSAFGLAVNWADLAHRKTTPEPQPTGFTNRWYVSSIELGQGVTPTTSATASDAYPDFLGRVQPYAVYVPTSYNAAGPAPLTWILHSLSLQHNEYGSLTPRFLQDACENRGSICATTLGRGPDGWYYDEAALDFFEVWNRLAASYRLDPERTILSGYSMGGWGTWKLGLSYPQLFAKAVVLAGPITCLGSNPRCENDDYYFNLADNARWLPYYVAQGGLDEFGLIVSATSEVAQLELLGYRYRYEVYPTEDHLVWVLEEDAFSSAAAQMGHPTRQHRPGHVTYKWYPDADRPDLGVDPGAVYWISGLTGRATVAGDIAEVDATSDAQPDPEVSTVRTEGVLTPTDARPALWEQVDWLTGSPPPASPSIDVALTKVGSLTISLPDAGFPKGSAGGVALTTDGPFTLTLTGLATGEPVALDGQRVATGSAGAAAVPVPTGSHSITFG